MCNLSRWLRDPPQCPGLSSYQHMISFILSPIPAPDCSILHLSLGLCPFQCLISSAPCSQYMTSDNGLFLSLLCSLPVFIFLISVARLLSCLFYYWGLLFCNLCLDLSGTVPQWLLDLLSFFSPFVLLSVDLSENAMAVMLGREFRFNHCFLQPQAIPLRILTRYLSARHNFKWSIKLVHLLLHSFIPSYQIT